ncbi:MAG: hypothetical protein P4L98_17000 [Ancalomicrobiaceae bacterium]|nr:hypothetical protein [Ancalomicrobiaceae bacterium]
MRKLCWIGIGLALVGAAPAAGEDRWWREVPDVYASQIWSGGGLLAGRTEFALGDDGRLIGQYSFVENDGTRERGTLDGCEPSGRRRLVCRWHDDYGDGLLKLQFSQGLDRFDGGWSQAGKAVRPWRGERIPRA